MWSALTFTLSPLDFFTQTITNFETLNTCSPWPNWRYIWPLNPSCASHMRVNWSLSFYFGPHLSLSHLKTWTQHIFVFSLSPNATHKIKHIFFSLINRSRNPITLITNLWIKLSQKQILLKQTSNLIYLFIYLFYCYYYYFVLVGFRGYYGWRGSPVWWFF